MPQLCELKIVVGGYYLLRCCKNSSEENEQKRIGFACNRLAWATYAQTSRALAEVMLLKLFKWTKEREREVRESKLYRYMRSLYTLACCYSCAFVAAAIRRETWAANRLSKSMCWVWEYSDNKIRGKRQPAERMLNPLFSVFCCLLPSGTCWALYVELDFVFSFVFAVKLSFLAGD